MNENYDNLVLAAKIVANNLIGLEGTTGWLKPISADFALRMGELLLGAINGHPTEQLLKESNDRYNGR